MTSCGQNSQSNEGIGREGGDVAPQKTPQLSTSSNAHHKHNSSQQQQQQVRLLVLNLIVTNIERSNIK